MTTWLGLRAVRWRDGRVHDHSQHDAAHADCAADAVVLLRVSLRGCADTGALTASERLLLWFIIGAFYFWIIHLSISPKTISKDPIFATISANICPLLNISKA